MYCIVYLYKRFDQLKPGRLTNLSRDIFDKLKQGRFDKGFIYFSYDGGIYSTCFKISAIELEFFDIDDTPAYINDHFK